MIADRILHTVSSRHTGRNPKMSMAASFLRMRKQINQPIQDRGGGASPVRMLLIKARIVSIMLHGAFQSISKGSSGPGALFKLLGSFPIAIDKLENKT
jgi:hypothetical protein